MMEAMNYCDCVPWDYPIPYEVIELRSIRICDFYGNSCFNSYIENGMAGNCTNQCDPDCDEIKYTISTEKEPIKWKDMCLYNSKDTENENKLDLFGIKTADYLKNAFHSGRSGIIEFQKASLNYENTTMFLQDYCETKFQNDIAIVEVVMDSPTVMKYIQRYKATETDKLANFGMQNVNNKGCKYIPVSYTHLTLPTKRIV